MTAEQEIREALNFRGYSRDLPWRQDALAALDRLVAERDALREALRQARECCARPSGVCFPQNPTEGRSDDGGVGWDNPATRKCAGAEATSESVAPASSEPSPAMSSTTADSGDPGSAATGRAALAEGER